ncbi:MAG: FAD-dependent oxidoreductase [Chitinophagia bacterium]
MALEWMEAVLTKIENETPNTKRFYFEIPSLEKFDFIPGQFVTLDLPIHEQKNKRWRSYSIASAPNGTNTFELIIVLLETGLGTPYLFNEAKVGTKVTLRGPQGVFVLPKNFEHDVYFVCTGTGIAPFRSMIRYIHEHKIVHNNIHLIFGCRKFEDGLYIDELKEIESKEPGFHFHPCYSREAEVPTGAHKGYVHPVYQELLKENKETAHVWLCGWKAMIDDARKNTADLGLDKKQVHFESFG